MVLCRIHILSKVYEGIELCKKEGVDFILAVGGGSVIDSCKAIAYGLGNPDVDVWDLFTGKATPKSMLSIRKCLNDRSSRKRDE